MSTLYSQSVSQMTAALMSTTTLPSASAITCRNTPFTFICAPELTCNLDSQIFFANMKYFNA